MLHAQASFPPLLLTPSQPRHVRIVPGTPPPHAFAATPCHLTLQPRRCFPLPTRCRRPQASHSPSPLSSLMPPSLPPLVPSSSPIGLICQHGRPYPPLAWPPSK